MDGKRAAAVFIDFIITSVIQCVLITYCIVHPLMKGVVFPAEDMMLKTLGITYISMCYMVLRDIPKYGSIGKRIVKLKIVSADTKKDAPLSRRILRNIFWLLGPVEIIAYILSGKRLGDRAAKTEVVPQ